MADKNKHFKQAVVMPSVEHGNWIVLAGTIVDSDCKVIFAPDPEKALEKLSIHDAGVLATRTGQFPTEGDRLPRAFCFSELKET